MQKLLRATSLYTADLEEIISDYSFSIKETHRGILQVLNIEGCVRLVVEHKIRGFIVETGVFTGGASAFLLRSIMRNGTARPDYWGFESFMGMPQPTHHDGDHGSFWIYNKLFKALSPKDINILAQTPT